MKETNPVEQRIEALAEKWKDAVDVKDVRVIRLHHKQEEESMVDAFLWYMLGIDSSIDDIAFILDPPFTDRETYSEKLLAALEDCIRLWNETGKKEGIDYVPVRWTADNSLADKENPAALFVRNFNKLSESLALEKGRYTVATLPFPHMPGKEKQLARWMEDVIKIGISPEVRFLVMDTKENPLFEDLLFKHAKEVAPLIPGFDMKNMMKQLAAMGEPSDPATPYRMAFVNMMHAIGERDSKTAEKEGRTCIDIATANISQNPQWTVQLVVVHTALANDRLGQNDLDEAVRWAEKAVKAARTLPATLGDDMGYPVLGQALMTRGAIRCYSKNWGKAKPDFEEAATCYENVKNWLMGMDASRMAGFCAVKAWQDGDAAKVLAGGFRMAEKLDSTVLRNSTFPLLLKQLLNKNYRDYVEYEEIDALASGVYGDAWRDAIDRAWKHSPDADLFYEGMSGVTDPVIQTTANPN
jgi:hypothetical protein